MNAFEKLYKDLKRKYKAPSGQWSLWCKRPKTPREREDVIIGAILTQRTNWQNVELAFKNLKAAKINSLSKILETNPKKLGHLIKPSGFYQTKAQYLINLAKFIIENYKTVAKMAKADRKELREQLLKLKGIGPETADSILLYALDKPVFVIDEYTRRLVKKRNLVKNLSYVALQEAFEKSLKKNFRFYQDFHALIVIDGKNQKNNPKSGVVG